MPLIIIKNNDKTTNFLSITLKIVCGMKKTIIRLIIKITHFNKVLFTAQLHSVYNRVELSRVFPAMGIE